MQIRLAVPGNIDMDSMGAAIDAALEATTTAQVPLIERGTIPDIRDAISQGRVRWRPEPPGDEHFDDARTVLSRGWGDCDDLAPWHAAGLRATGEDPGAQAFVYQSGPRRWHAVVQRSNGIVDDPSAWAGMKARGKDAGVVGAGPPIWAPMWDGRLGLAAYPTQAGWAGRVDVPDQSWPLSWSALSMGPTPGHAIVGAIRGAYNTASCVGDPRDIDLMRLCGIDALICGQDMDVVGDILGDVGFLPALLPAAGALMGPAMGMLGNIIPGLGGKPPPPPPPGAAPAPGGGGGGLSPGTTLTMPGGPIIVRF